MISKGKYLLKNVRLFAHNVLVTGSQVLSCARLIKGASAREQFAFKTILAVSSTEFLSKASDLHF